MVIEITNLSIKAARVERGFTQDAIAQMLGVTSKTYQQWENGDVIPKPMTMFALAYILKMDVNMLRIPEKE